jgi:molybdopterin synthase sulfur carrier subunit
MTANIELPHILAQLCQGAREIPVEGATVDAALHDLVRRHPLLRRHLFDDSGGLRGYINVYRNEEDVRFTEMGLGTKIRSGDTLLIVASVAGGS